MQVGELVIRRVKGMTDHRLRSAVEQRERLGFGVIISKYRAGAPEHDCISVYYPKIGKIYDIAESLVEVIGQKR